MAGLVLGTAGTLSPNGAWNCFGQTGLFGGAQKAIVKIATNNRIVLSMVLVPK